MIQHVTGSFRVHLIWQHVTIAQVLKQMFGNMLQSRPYQFLVFNSFRVRLI